MSEWRPLREVAKSDLTRAMLESAAEDGPRPGARERALEGLGLGAASVVLASTAPKAAVALVKGAATVLPGATKTSGWMLAVWIGAGVVVGGSAVVYESVDRVLAIPSAGVPSVTASGRASPRSPSVPSSEPTAAPLPSPSAAPIFEPARVPAPSPSSPRRVKRLAPNPVVAATRAVAPSEASAPPASEATAPGVPMAVRLRRLIAIRDALRANEPARALALLDELERVDPVSPASEEVTVLRVDALVALGRHDDASRLGSAFLEQHPTSAYAERIRRKVQLR